MYNLFSLIINRHSSQMPGLQAFGGPIASSKDFHSVLTVVQVSESFPSLLLVSSSLWSCRYHSLLFYFYIFYFFTKSGIICLSACHLQNLVEIHVLLFPVYVVIEDMLFENSQLCFYRFEEELYINICIQSLNLWCFKSKKH